PPPPPPTTPLLTTNTPLVSHPPPHPAQAYGAGATSIHLDLEYSRALAHWAGLGFVQGAGIGARSFTFVTRDCFHSVAAPHLLLLPDKNRVHDGPDVFAGKQNVHAP